MQIVCHTPKIHFSPLSCLTSSYLFVVCHLFSPHFAASAIFSFSERGFSKFLKLALSFYSQIGHISVLYYRRSQKDAPFYFPPEVISPSCLRHPFPKANFQIICKHRTYPSPNSMIIHRTQKGSLFREPFFLQKKQLLVTLNIIPSESGESHEPRIRNLIFRKFFFLAAPDGGTERDALPQRHPGILS